MARGWLYQKKEKQRKMRRAYLKHNPSRIDPYRSAELFKQMREGLKNSHVEIPKTLGISDPKLACINKIKELIEDVPMSRHVRIHAKGYLNLLLFFSEKGDKWFFIESTISPLRVRKSILYPNKELAKEAFLANHIIWVEQVLPTKDMVRAANRPPGS